MQPSDPQIDLVARLQEEQQRRPVAHSETDTIEVDKLGDTVRIKAAPRAESPQREMLRQPWIAD